MTGKALETERRVKGSAAMVRGMAPRAVPGRVVFRTAESETVPAEVLGTFREEEGLSVIVPAGPADPDHQVMRQITLDVHSALDGVGLTAAVASALSDRGIACNVVAAHHHDHVFVPEARAEEELMILKDLAARA